MTAHLSSYNATSHHVHNDIVARVEFRRRVRELEELAAEEKIALPMPATWIATLEALGYIVDLLTGHWTDADSVSYTPTEAAQRLTLEDAQ